MRDHLSPANLVTTLGLGLGFAALLLAQQRPLAAGGLLVGSAVLDGVDGALARRSGCDRAFGGQLDSLTDIVCFGVVPAATLWWALLHRVPVLGALACTAFLVAGAWRLARFHLVQRPDRYVGLPIPAAGLLLMGVALWAPLVWVAAAAAFALSALMVSSYAIPTLQVIAGALPPAPRPHSPTRRRHRPLRAIVRSRGGRRGPGSRGSVLRRLRRTTIRTRSGRR